jgi:hypothetical protein
MIQLHTISPNEPISYWFNEAAAVSSDLAGTVYGLCKEDGLPEPYLYREFPEEDPTSRLRGIALQKYLDEKHPEIVSIVTTAPVLVAQRSDRSRFGSVVRRFGGGASKGVADGFTNLSLPLKVRLEMALTLAIEVGSLHSSGLVHGEIKGSTVRYVTDSLALTPPIALMDVDSAGVVTESQSWAIEPGPRPPLDLRNPFVAPEITADGGTQSMSIHGDRWSLAVALHTLLLYPQNPLAIYGKALPGADRLSWLAVNASAPLAWPPAPTADDEDAVRVHQQELARLGSSIPLAFTTTFSRQRPAEDLRPDRRISGTTWARVLRRSLEGLKSCSKTFPDSDVPHGDYVSRHDSPCPFCQNAALNVLSPGNPYIKP